MALADKDRIFTNVYGYQPWNLKEAQARGVGATIAVVDRVAEVAEEMDHHPDIDIRWRRLTFRLSTHSAGGVTELDAELARRIDEIISSAVR